MKRNWMLLSVLLVASALKAQSAQTAAGPVTAAVPVIKRSQLSPTLRNLLSFMGDRLAIAGNERLTLTGTISLTGGGQTPVQVILELPDHLRYEQAIPHRIITYDGTTVTTSTGAPSAADYALVESFTLDGVERFLNAQTEGHALRLVGPQVQLKAAAPLSSTSICELYELSDRERFIVNLKSKQKLFCFDNRSRLLASVLYQNPGPGHAIHVETRWSNWLLSGKNPIARNITRYENGSPVFSLTVLTTAVSPQVSDAIFSKP